MEKKKVNSYRDLIVWQKSIELAKGLYGLTRSFPEDERFGLIAQIRRSAVSGPSNIAEGQARRTSKDFIQFLYISKGSLAELDTQLTLSHQLGFITEDSHASFLSHIDGLQRMIFTLITRLGGKR